MTSHNKSTDAKGTDSDNEPKRTVADLEAEIALTRVELVDTVNALANRMKPKVLADHASATTKVAAQDTAAFLSGNGMPLEKRQARNVKVLLGVGAAVIAGVGLVILRSRRK